MTGVNSFIELPFCLQLGTLNTSVYLLDKMPSNHGMIWTTIHPRWPLIYNAIMSSRDGLPDQNKGLFRLKQMDSKQDWLRPVQLTMCDGDKSISTYLHKKQVQTCFAPT